MKISSIQLMSQFFNSEDIVGHSRVGYYYYYYYYMVGWF